jgi:pentatricopeptide repeat protein
MYENTHKCTAYNALINSCAAVGDVDRAMRVLGQMYDDGLLPDAITYTSLIKTAAAANNADIAEEVSVVFSRYDFNILLTLVQAFNQRCITQLLWFG